MTGLGEVGLECKIILVGNISAGGKELVDAGGGVGENEGSGLSLGRVLGSFDFGVDFCDEQFGKVAWFGMGGIEAGGCCLRYLTA